jgi:hypothetical protein
VLELEVSGLACLRERSSPEAELFRAPQVIRS